MSQSNNSGPEKNIVDAQQAIERVSNSPESGEKLAKQILDAREMLEAAVQETESTEDRLPLMIALKDIQSLEAVLAGAGKNRQLTEKEKSKLSSAAEKLSPKLKILDVVFDVVKFSTDFSQDISEKNKIESGLDDGPRFVSNCEAALAITRNLRARYSNFSQDLNSYFGAGKIPAEIKTELSKINKVLSEMEAKDKLLKVKLDQVRSGIVIGSGQDISLAKEKDVGFAKPPHIAEAEVVINQFTQQQKLEILKLAMEGEQLNEQQKQRVQQVGILKTMLLAIKSDIKTSRTWGEWSTQAFTEFDGTTNAKTLRVDQMIHELDEVVEQITADPTKSIGQLVSQKTRQLLLDYNLDEKVPALMDSKGRLKEASSFKDIQTQYLGLVEFLRDRKDYASAQKLIEENLLGPQFAAKRNTLTEAEKKKAHGSARKKILKMASSAQEEWDKQGLTEAQQNGFIDALVEEETKRNLNKVVAQMNNGLPFEDLKGVDKKIMESYKDMMGYGEWHNFSDESWDKIIEETIINAPLILISGGAATVGRGLLSAGARAVIASGRFARIGLTVAKGAETITATGKIGKALYWSGRGVGLLAEGTAFETVYSGLHGENLFEGGWEKFPEWGKRILWSSATLGVFHVAGAGATEVNKVILKHISKFPDKSIRAAIQKLAVTGSGETAAMLGIGAVQHYMETGEMDDWHFTNELFHALITVGALKIAGGGVEVAKKKFFPQGGPKVGPEVEIKPEEGVDSSGNVVVDSLMETALEGSEGLQRSIEMIGSMDRLTLSAKQLLLVTSKLPDVASRERFLKACGEKMTPEQRLQLETVLGVTAEGVENTSKVDTTVVDTLRQFGTRGREWLVNTVRSAVAHGVAVMENRNPIIVEKANFETLDIARGGEKSLVFDLAAPGSARNADPILVEGWKSRSQGELCSLMTSQGIPNELVNKARTSHAEISPDLQQFVRIVVAEGKGKGGGLEPFVFVDQAGMKAKFGLDLPGIEAVLKAEGIVMPETLGELAKATGVPVEFLTRMTGLNDKQVMSGQVAFDITTLLGIGLGKAFWGAVRGTWWLGGKGIGLGRKLLTGKPGTVGPDGKLIEGPKPEAAHFQTLDEIMAGLKVTKLSDNLDPAQIAALGERYSVIKTLLGHLLYDPAAKSKDKSTTPELERKNAEMVLKILVEIEYTNLRLEKIHGVATTPATAGRTAAEIGRDIKDIGEANTVAELHKQLAALGGKAMLQARQKALLKGKPRGTKLADLIATIVADRDKKNAKGKPEHSKERIAELQKEIDAIKKLGDDLDHVEILEELITKREALDKELADVNKPKAAGSEQAELAKKLNGLYEQLFGIMTTGAIDINTADGSSKTWALKKKWKIPVGVERGIVEGKIRDDISDPKTDLTPAEAGAALTEIAEVLRANQENFKRLKELEVSCMLGEKEYKLLKPIATANDPTHPKTIEALAYVNFYEKMMAQRDALRTSANSTGEKLKRNPLWQVAMKHKIAAAILVTLIGATAYRIVQRVFKDNTPEIGQDGETGDPVIDADEKGADEADDAILNQVDTPPPTPPSKGGAKASGGNKPSGGSATPEVPEPEPAPEPAPENPSNAPLSKEQRMRMLGGE